MWNEDEFEECSSGVSQPITHDHITSTLVLRRLSLHLEWAKRLIPMMVIVFTLLTIISKSNKSDFFTRAYPDQSVESVFLERSQRFLSDVGHRLLLGVLVWGEGGGKTMDGFRNIDLSMLWVDAFYAGRLAHVLRAKEWKWNVMGYRISAFIFGRQS